MKNKWNYPFVALAILMLIPSALSVSAAWYFMTSASPSKSEALIGIAYMSIYSVILWAPFIIGVIIFWRKLDRIVLLTTPIPFLLMALAVIYGTLNGLPW